MADVQYTTLYLPDGTGVSVVVGSQLYLTYVASGATTSPRTYTTSTSTDPAAPDVRTLVATVWFNTPFGPQPITAPDVIDEYRRRDYAEMTAAQAAAFYASGAEIPDVSYVTGVELSTAIAGVTPSDSSVAALVSGNGATATALRAAFGARPLTAALGIFRAAAEVRDTEPVVVVGAGSSTTAGSQATAEEKRWLNLFARYLHAQYPLSSGLASPATRVLSAAVASPPAAPGVQFVNAGAGGTTSANYLNATMRGQIASFNPRMIVHMAGSNDFAAGVPVATFKANVAGHIDALDALLTEPCVHLLVQSFERSDAFTPVAPWSAYGEALAQLAVADPERRAYIDVSNAFDRADVTGADPFGYMSSDRIHVLDPGHALIASEVCGATGVRAAVPVPAPTALPAQVTTLTATARNRSIDAAWQQTPTATSYFLEYRTGAGAWTGVTLYKLTHTITGLTNGTAYDVRITPRNGLGDGLVSAITTATPAAPALSVYTSDSFTGADALTVRARSTDAALGGTAKVWETSNTNTSLALTGGVLVRGSNLGAQFAGFLVASADVSVSAKFVAVPSASSLNLIARRAALATGDSYAVEVLQGGGTARLKHGATNLGTSFSVVAGDTVELRCSGSTITALVNGVIKAEVEDTGLATAGYAGISASTNTTSFQLDDVIVKAAA